MNNIKIALIIVVAIFATVSCKKKTAEDVSEIVDVSYPEVTITGPQFVSIPIGGTFSDQGSSGKDAATGELSLQPMSVTNNIDATTPGFYTVAYTYKNKYGYITVGTRFVLVTDISPTQDISGVYLRGSSGTANVTKIATGLYKTDNVGGVPLPASEDFRGTAYFGFTDSTTVELPVQNSPELGPVGARAGLYKSDSVSTTLSWIMTNGPFNTTVTRLFVKQ
jgi:hypothetical protein